MQLTDRNKRRRTAGPALLGALTAMAAAPDALAAGSIPASVQTTGLWAVGLAAALALAAVLLVLLRRRDRRLRELEAAMETDPVTGIGNYAYLERCCEQYLHEKDRPLYRLFYFTTNIDHIRRVSDGEEANAFLCHAAQVLGEYAGEMDAIARVSDGGFVLMRRCGSETEATRLAETVLEGLRDYPRRRGKPFRVEACAGIYHLECGDSDLRPCVFKAEQSSIYARDNGLDCAECSQTIVELYREERSLQKGVRRTLENEEIELYLHFFVDARTMKITGAEALSRWRHPEKGMLLPGQFVPLMERERMVSELDYYILERVCRVLESLWATHTTEFFISCNFSRNTFGSTEFVERCTAIIDRYHFPREMLILELTESGITNEAAVVYQNAVDMKERGVSIVLDDFGTGYATFADLQDFQFDGLKLDKSFADHLFTRDGEIIMQGIVDTVHRLGLTVLAEGVETEEQVRKVVALKCDAIQGFYFYKPLPLREAMQVYLEQQAKQEA